MRGLAAVLRHEIAERRLLLLASPVLGLLPLAAPLTSAGSAGSELRDIEALFLALALSGLSALLLGASVVGADLASRRLAFFFSRPLTGGAVWAGKLGAAAICAWTAGLLALLPSRLFDATANGGDGSFPNHALLSWPWLAIWFGAVPLTVLIAHHGGVILRTRSAWLVLDLAGAVTVGAIVLWTLRRLQYWGALPDPSPVAPLVAIGAGAVGIALLAASAAQVIDGRADPVRGHRILSLTFAGLGLAGALAFAVLAQRWIAIGPLDLDRWSFAAVAPGQRWIALAGPAPGPREYGAAFLLEVGSGRSVRARFAKRAEDTLPLAFSADGRRAIWAEYQGRQGTSPGVLVSLALDRAGAMPVRTPIVEAAPPAKLVLSPHGARIAAVTGRHVAVYELDSGRLLAAHTFGEALDWPVTVVFRDEDHLRLLVSRDEVSGEQALAVYDLDLASRRLAGLATLPCGWLRMLSPDAERVACNNRPPKAAAAFDLASGRQLAELRQPGAKVRAAYLADGRLALLAQGPAGTEVTILDGDGRLPPGAPRFRLPPGATLVWFWMPEEDTFSWIVQTDAHRLLAREILRDRPLGARTSWNVLDLARGGTRSLGPDGLRLLPPWGVTAAGSAPLFSDGARLLRIDLATGEAHALGPARPYRAPYVE
ncbi:MAG TPA: hypothetical protein VJA16_14210 [Thermoanaerobaculia bacterium]